MGAHRRVYRPFEYALPADFPERLGRFQEASGLTWRSLARRLGVSPSRLRKWRKAGVAPSGAHLFLLLTLAESMGLRDGILMCSERDLPGNGELSALRW